MVQSVPELPEVLGRVADPGVFYQDPDPTFERKKTDPNLTKF